jgi:triacylglycerol lipase
MWKKNTIPDPIWKYVFYPPERGEYIYFEGDPPTQAGSNIAGWMADAAMLAYARYGSNPMDRVEFDDILIKAGFTCHARIGNWSNGPKGTQAFFAYNSDYAILSFRGTERDDWKDFATDGFLWLVAPSGAASTQAPAKTMWHLPFSRPVLSPGEPGVHAGFQHALNDVWPEISDWLDSYAQKYPGKRIYFTGHSLGAALAALAITRFKGPASLYTIGCPRIGNGPFCGPVDALAEKGEVFQYVNGVDLVTHVPPRELWYADIAGKLLIDAQGKIQPGQPDERKWAELVSDLKVAAEAAAGGSDLNGRPPDGLRDHSPARYCYWIWKVQPA